MVEEKQLFPPELLIFLLLAPMTLDIVGDSINTSMRSHGGEPYE